MSPNLDNTQTKKNALPTFDVQIKNTPAERMRERGVFSLSDVELLSLLLHADQPADFPLETAQKMLRQANNSLVRLAKMSIGELQEMMELTPVQAQGLVSALELGRRLQHATNNTHAANFLPTAANVHNMMKPYLCNLPYEEFWVILLNHNHKILGKRQVNQGTTQSIACDVKKLFRLVLSEPLCTSILLVHNHPAGCVKPSPEDVNLTRNLYRTSQFLGITFSDHIICANDSCYSFKEEGVLTALWEENPEQAHV